MKKYQIPSKNHQKWHELLNGELNLPLKNFVFQMKVTQAINQIRKGTLNIDTAIDEIYALCSKFKAAKNMRADLALIFGTENLVPENTTLQENTQSSDEDINQYKLLFFKKALALKEKDLKEKDALILNLQDEVILLKKKYALLKKGIGKIQDSSGVNKEKNNWSFFNLFKK